MKIFYFVLGFVILAAIPALCLDCDAEEYTQHQISCTDSNAKSGLIWKAVDGNESKILVTCGLSNCVPQSQAEFEATLNDNTSVLTIKNVSRTSPFNMETRWYCETQGGEEDACPSLRVFVTPKKPVCGRPYLNVSTYEISVTCTTGRVYPQAECQMYMFKEEESPGPRSVPDTKTYQHNLIEEDPHYYSTQCTLTIPLSHLAGYGDHFQVRMNPNGSLQFSNYSDIQQIRLALDNEETGEDTPDDDFSDDGADDVPLSVAIVLGVLLGVVVVVVVVLGVCLCRRKGKMEPPAQKLPKQAKSKTTAQKLPDNTKSTPKSYDNLGSKTQDQEMYEEVDVRPGGGTTMGQRSSEPIEEDWYHNAESMVDQENEEIYEN